MNHRVKQRVVVLLVVILCLYIVIPEVIPNYIIECFTLTKDYDNLKPKLQPVPHKFSQKEIKLLDQQPSNIDVKDLPQSVIDGVKTFL